MKEGLVTITMSAFNSAKTIGTAIESVLAQTYTLWELIVIDDASTDDTYLKVQEYSNKDNRIRVFKNDINRGTYWNRNKAILLGKGEFITNLDSDDSFLPNKLAVQIEKIGIAAACICHFQRRGQGNQIALGSNTLLFKRETLSTIGYFDSVRYDADTEHLRRLGICYPIMQIPNILYNYNVTESSLTETAETGTHTEAGRAKRRAYQQNYSYWHRSDSFPYTNFPIVKRAFSIGHDSQACPKEKITVSLATFPERKESLRKTIDSVFPWVDSINVLLNEYEEVPSFLENPKIQAHLPDTDLGDTGKFYWATKTDGYHFICDDDIEYNRAYFELMLRKIEQYDREAIISLHGSILRKKKDVDYYSDADRTIFSFRQSMEKDRAVDFIGTGVMAYHTEKIKLSLDIFEDINMADVFLGIYAKKNNIPLIRCQSQENTVGDCDVQVQEKSIYIHSFENLGTKLNKRSAINDYLSEVNWASL